LTSFKIPILSLEVLFGRNDLYGRHVCWWWRKGTIPTCGGAHDVV